MPTPSNVAPLKLDHFNQITLALAIVASCIQVAGDVVAHQLHFVVNSSAPATNAELKTRAKALHRHPEKTNERNTLMSDWRDPVRGPWAIARFFVQSNLTKPQQTASDADLSTCIVFLEQCKVWSPSNQHLGSLSRLRKLRNENWGHQPLTSDATEAQVENVLQTAQACLKDLDTLLLPGNDVERAKFHCLRKEAIEKIGSFHTTAVKQSNSKQLIEQYLACEATRSQSIDNLRDESRWIRCFSLSALVVAIVAILAVFISVWHNSSGGPVSGNHNLPLLRHPHLVMPSRYRAVPQWFHGRTSELKRLDSLFAHGQRQAHAIVTGVAGGGKTSLAAYFALMHVTNYSCVVWLDKHDYATVPLSNETLAKFTLCSGNALALFDNVEDIGLVLETLNNITISRLSVLATTRLTESASMARWEEVPLSPLSVDIMARILCKDLSPQFVCDANVSDVQRFIKVTDGLSLALHHANRLLRYGSKSLAQLVDDLEESLTALDAEEWEQKQALRDDGLSNGLVALFNQTEMLLRRRVDADNTVGWNEVWELGLQLAWWAPNHPVPLFLLGNTTEEGRRQDAAGHADWTFASVWHFLRQYLPSWLDVSYFAKRDQEHTPGDSLLAKSVNNTCILNHALSVLRNRTRPHLRHLAAVNLVSIDSCGQPTVTHPLLHRYLRYRDTHATGRRVAVKTIQLLLADVPWIDLESMWLTCVVTPHVIELARCVALANDTAQLGHLASFLLPRLFDKTESLYGNCSMAMLTPLYQIRGPNSPFALGCVEYPHMYAMFRSATSPAAVFWRTLCHDKKTKILCYDITDALSRNAPSDAAAFFMLLFHADTYYHMYQSPKEPPSLARAIMISNQANLSCGPCYRLIVLTVRGTIAYRQARYTDSVKWLRKAAEMPNTRHCQPEWNKWLALANAHWRNSNYSEALRHYRDLSKEGRYTHEAMSWSLGGKWTTNKTATCVFEGIALLSTSVALSNPTVVIQELDFAQQAAYHWAAHLHNRYNKEPRPNQGCSAQEKLYNQSLGYTHGDMQVASQLRLLLWNAAAELAEEMGETRAALRYYRFMRSICNNWPEQGEPLTSGNLMNLLNVLKSVGLNKVPLGVYFVCRWIRVQIGCLETGFCRVRKPEYSQSFDVTTNAQGTRPQVTGSLTIDVDTEYVEKLTGFPEPPPVWYQVWYAKIPKSTMTFLREGAEPVTVQQPMFKNVPVTFSV